MNNKISCDVIKDLLPLYKDDVCSEKSKDLIEGHLPECEDCREYLDRLNLELPPVTLAQDGNGPDSPVSEGIEIFRKISRQINWLKVVGILAVAITVLVISTALSVVKEYNPELHLFDRRVAAEDVEITELYQLKNGDFYITLESEYPCSPVSYGTIDSPDGKLYTESYTGESCLSLEKASKLEHLFLSKLDIQAYSFVVPAEEILEQEDLHPDDPDFWHFPATVHKNTLIYYKGKHNERFTIWKEGQEVKQAPESVEERVRQQRYIQENGSEHLAGSEESSEYSDNILILY